MRRIYLLGLIVLLGLLSLTGCYREPPLHLYDKETPVIDIPFAEVKLDLYWYYNDDYKWRSEWYYGKDDENGPGWDDEDKRIFGELEYVEPSHFHLRRYFTDEKPFGKRIMKKEAYITGRTFRTQYEWGFWDILAWNDITTLDGVQSLHFDEKSSFDEPITATTSETQYSSRYHAPRYQHSFYEPEQLFSACECGIDINRNLEGFVFYEKENMWIRELSMYLEPITYIYLPQVILHHNKGRINYVPGIANLSGMAKSTTLNTGIAGSDAIAVNFKVRLKNGKDMNGEKVDVIGGRLMTFGICGQNANRITRAEESIDRERHYLDVAMQFNNGVDSTFVFDVTDQVRKRYKGGVITVELDMDTVHIPTQSGFNAIIKDYDEVVVPDIDL